MTWKSSWACTAVAFVTEATMFGFGKNRVLYLLQKGNFKNAKKNGAHNTHPLSKKKTIALPQNDQNGNFRQASQHYLQQITTSWLQVV